MDKYLDGIGLKELWKLIQERSLPIRKVTKNEYDNLSDEEKLKDILFLITKD